jgi:hypothetical protein
MATSFSAHALRLQYPQISEPAYELVALTKLPNNLIPNYVNTINCAVLLPLPTQVPILDVFDRVKPIIFTSSKAQTMA